MFGLADYYHLNRFSYLNQRQLPMFLNKCYWTSSCYWTLSIKKSDWLYGYFGLLLFSFVWFSNFNCIWFDTAKCLGRSMAMLLFTSHYTLPMVPILLMASVNTYSRCRSKPKILKLMQFLFYFFLCKFVFFTIFEFRSFIIPKPLRDVHKHIDTIPKERSICSTIFFHLIFYIPWNFWISFLRGEDILFLKT